MLFIGSIKFVTSKGNLERQKITKKVLTNYLVPK